MNSKKSFSIQMFKVGSMVHLEGRGETRGWGWRSGGRDGGRVQGRGGGERIRKIEKGGGN